MTFTTTRPSVQLRIRERLNGERDAIDLQLPTRPTIKARAVVKFPARIDGDNGITVTKANGVYTISDEFDTLSELESIDDSSVTYVKLLFEGVYYYFSIASLVEAISSAGTPQVITAAGDLTIESTHRYVVFNKTVGAATGVTLPASADRDDALVIKDGKGDASTNNITITPDGSETIDGLSAWVISFDYGGVTLVPRPDGNGWWTR